MRVFLTGATGFVGRNFAEYLLRTAPEASLTCLVRDPVKAAFLEGRAELCQGDLLSPETYRTAVAESDLIIHAAALVSLRNGPEFDAQNRQATANLLQAAQTASSLQRFVFVGSIAAYDRDMSQPATAPLTEDTPPHPNTDYGRSKLQAQHDVIASGLPYTMLVPAYIFGPHPRIGSSMDKLLLDTAASKRYTRIPFPGHASYIYVEDLADCLWHCARHPGSENEVFFASEREPLQVGEAFRRVAEALGQAYIPREVHDMARFQKAIYRKYPDAPLMRILFEDFFRCSAEKLYMQTGYLPRIGLSEGIERTLAWYREAGRL